LRALASRARSGMVGLQQRSGEIRLFMVRRISRSAEVGYKLSGTGTTAFLRLTVTAKGDTFISVETTEVAATEEWTAENMDHIRDNAIRIADLESKLEYYLEYYLKLSSSHSPPSAWPEHAHLDDQARRRLDEKARHQYEHLHEYLPRLELPLRRDIILAQEDTNRRYSSLINAEPIVARMIPNPVILSQHSMRTEHEYALYREAVWRCERQLLPDQWRVLVDDYIAREEAEFSRALRLKAPQPEGICIVLSSRETLRVNGGAEKETEDERLNAKTIFDAYLIVDWSASKKRKTGRDSIWYSLHKRVDGELTLSHYEMCL
jgi:hypothetical protein